MKKGKKKLKGMTLIEMIITIAVLAMLCVILAMVGQNIDATARSTNAIKDKVVKESPYAANRVKEFRSSDGTPVALAVESGTMSISIPGTFNGISDPQVNLAIDKYDTEQIALDGRTAKEIQTIKEGPNGGLNLKFYDFPASTTTDVTTAPVVTTTTT